MAPSVKTTQLQAAKYSEAAKLRQIAVVNYKGKDGRSVASEVEAMLASVQVGEAPYFTLVERNQLNRVMSEIKKTNADFFFDNSAAAEVGRLVGAKAIYTGQINANTVTDESYTQKRKKCVQKVKTGKRILGVDVTKCVKKKKVTISCLKRTAIFKFTPKIIEVETGRIVYARKISTTKSDQGCPDEDNRMIAAGTQLMDQARESAILRMRQDIAPHLVTVSIALMEEEEGIESEAARKKLQRGMEFARANRMDRACEIWSHGHKLSPDAPAFLFNMGACSETSGDLTTALSWYTKADRAMLHPDDKMNAALHRVKEALNERDTLRDQLKKKQQNHNASGF
ncbi:MAG: hypothetical protein HQL54_13940 [Magnetococcales bacterium]|nr:hypothetical protein [Magnetococcales bacterium]